MRTSSAIRWLVVALQDDVCVGAPEAEGIDADDERLDRIERGLLGDHLQVEFVEGNLGIGCLEMDRAGNRTVLEAQQRLDHAGHAGGRLQVSQVALDRTHEQRRPRRAPLAQRLPERTGLDRIADGGTGAVRFEVVDVRGIDAGPCVNIAQQGRLRLGARHSDAVGLAVAVQAGTRDDRVDPVAIGNGGVKGFEHHHGAAFGPHIAVAGGIENLAAAAPR